MKYLAFLMTFIILSLSVIPCTDGAGTCSYEHGHEHSQDEQDDCTPFCVFLPFLLSSSR